jgi:hypothetical protein
VLEHPLGGLVGLAERGRAEGPRHVELVADLVEARRQLRPGRLARQRVHRHDG